MKSYPLVQLKAKRLQFKNNFVVMSHEAQMAYDAIQHLMGRGRRRIALITVKQSPFIEPRRDNGYRQALCDAGAEVDKELIFYGDYTYDMTIRQPFFICQYYPPKIDKNHSLIFRRFLQ